MARRVVSFECDPSLDHIEIVIRAPREDETVHDLMDLVRDAPPGALTVFDGSGSTCIVMPQEIVTVAAEGRLVHVVTEKGSWYLRRTLQSLEAELDARRFVRVSRYELVNLDKVLKYDFTISGTLRLELVGGMETWASRRCIPEIRKRLKGRE